MALIKCLECGKQVSDKDAQCPSCAYPINKGNGALTYEPDTILIPVGEFEMGSNENDDEKPIHTVNLNEYY